MSQKSAPSPVDQSYLIERAQPATSASSGASDSGENSNRCGPVNLEPPVRHVVRGRFHQEPGFEVPARVEGRVGQVDGADEDRLVAPVRCEEAQDLRMEPAARCLAVWATPHDALRQPRP